MPVILDEVACNMHLKKGNYSIIEYNISKIPSIMPKVVYILKNSKPELI